MGVASDNAPVGTTIGTCEEGVVVPENWVIVGRGWISYCGGDFNKPNTIEIMKVPPGGDLAVNPQVFSVVACNGSPIPKHYRVGERLHSHRCFGTINVKNAMILSTTLSGGHLEP